jgi:hypothetical protein
VRPGLGSVVVLLAGTVSSGCNLLVDSAGFATAESKDGGREGRADAMSPAEDAQTESNDAGAPTCTAEPGASDCTTCVASNCCAPSLACAAGSACDALLACEAPCNGDQACVSACEAQYPAGATPLSALLDCASTSCSICEYGGVGDWCGSCQTGLVCAGSGESAFCSRSCARDSDCAGTGGGGLNVNGTANVCALNGDSQNTCFPGCASDADCAPYPGLSCVVGLSPGGVDAKICAIPSSPPDAGTP